MIGDKLTYGSLQFSSRLGTSVLMDDISCSAEYKK